MKRAYYSSTPRLQAVRKKYLTYPIRRFYRVAGLDQKLEWALALFYHIFVVGGVALTAAGSAKLQSHEEPVEKAEKLVKAGIGILTVCWVALVAGTVASFIAPVRKSALGRAGTMVCFLY